MDQIQLDRCGLGVLSWFTIASPMGKDINHDAVMVAYDDDHVLMAVADGVGGGKLPAQASLQCLHHIAEHFQQTRGRAGIVEGIESANAAIISLGSGAATTITVVHISDKHVQTFHAGDSAAFVIGQRGKLKYETITHGPVGYGLAAGMLNDQEALAHEQRHIVSNVVGDSQMHIVVGPTLALAKNDTILAVTDGITDNLPMEAMIQVVRKGKLELAAQLLLSQCHRIMQGTHEQTYKPDDLSFVLFRPT